MLAINALQNDNKKSEQNGFASLVRGAIGMFRNPTAHALRIYWSMTKEDAEDLLSLVADSPASGCITLAIPRLA